MGQREEERDAQLTGEIGWVPARSKRMNVLICAWLNVLWVSLPFIQIGVLGELRYFTGAKGLTTPDIGVPVLLSSLGGAVILSIPRWCRIGTIFAVGGFWLAMSFALAFYLANSGWGPIAFCATWLFREGREWKP